jgi:hypothetical protein
MVIALGCADVARAQCPEPYTSDELIVDVQGIENAVIAQDPRVAMAFAERIQESLACVDQRLPLNFLSRIYRGVAGGFFVGGDEASAQRWLAVAIEIDETFRYGVEDLPLDHPLRAAYAQALAQPRVDPDPVSGRALADGAIWLDGRRLGVPAATPGRPHLLQVERAGLVSTWLLDGASFPAEALAEPTTSLTGTSSRSRKTTRFAAEVHEFGQGAVMVDRSQPPEQVPLILTGAGLVLASGGMYAGAVVSRRNFDSIQDSEAKLQQSHRVTNRLVLGAAAVLTVGVGVLSYGILIDDAGVPTGLRLQGKF